MNTVIIAIDVDGTLRCNCTDTCQDVNRRIVDLLYILKHFKNVKIMVWSGGGVEYARNFMSKFEVAKGVHYASKVDKSTWKWGQPDIAIDDIQEFNLGKVNLIVREK